MWLKTTLILLIVLFPFNVLAAPSISSVSGTVSDGSSITLSGSGFGTSTVANIEWLGGPTGNIESGTLGNAFVRTGWTVSPNGASSIAPTYNNTFSHSGTKSILSAYEGCDNGCGTNKYGSLYAFNIGSVQSQGYATFWVYVDKSGGSTPGVQWKKWRLRHDSSQTDADGELMSSDWYLSTGARSQNYIMYFCDTDAYAQCYPGSDASLRWLEATDFVNVGSWQRIELYAKASSGAGIRDGSVFYYLHPQTSAVVISKGDDGTVITRATGVTNQWQWFHWDGYVGNNSPDTQDRSNWKLYQDDMYIQWGNGPARVEICNNATWASRTHCEIQYPTAWAAGEITATVNRGSFGSSDIAYLYTIDSSGNVSPAYTVTFGGGGGGSGPGSVEIGSGGSLGIGTGGSLVIQ